MTIYWIDGINGDDGKDGLSEANAWASFNHAATWNTGDTVYVKDGLYTETIIFSGATKAPNIIGIGDSVWIDGENIRSYCFQANFSSGNTGYSVENLKFKNFVTYGLYLRQDGAIDTGHDYAGIFRNCLITNDSPASRVGTGIRVWTNNDKFMFINCQVERCATAVTNAGVLRNNLFRDYNTLGTYFSIGYCSYPGGAGTNVDYTTTPPTFRDAANWDYSVDPLGANAASYIANGWEGSNIGMEAGRQTTFTSHNIDLGFNSGGSIWGDWINDDDCYDKDFPSITIAVGVNDALDFDEGGAELNATLANAVYTSDSVFRAAVKAALEAVGGDTYTVTWVDGHIVIVKDGGGTFNILSNTGTNVATSAWQDVGFSAEIDHNGTTTYTSTYAVTGGPGSLFVITISAARGNNKLDFDEGGGELTATVGDVSTSTLATVAAAVKAALDAAGGDTYTVTYDGDGDHSRRLRISSDGGTLTLKISTGTNVASSAWDMLGWDLAADKSGATDYLADYQTTSSPWGLDSDRRPTFDTDYEPDSRMCIGRSPVMDTGDDRNIRNIEWRGTEDAGNNRVFNADDVVGTSSNRTVELRADPSTFLEDSADSGLTKNFTKFNRFDVVNWSEQYAQVRWTLRVVKL